MYVYLPVISIVHLHFPGTTGPEVPPPPTPPAPTNHLPPPPAPTEPGLHPPPPPAPNEPRLHSPPTPINQPLTGDKDIGQEGGGQAGKREKKGEEGEEVLSPRKFNTETL